MGNGEWGMGNGEWGMGNGEWGLGIVPGQLGPHNLIAQSLKPHAPASASRC
jgi:hypothetical protein